MILYTTNQKQECRVQFSYSPSPVIEPNPDIQWASLMTLNPGMIMDPIDGSIHMLFRASGPCYKNIFPEKPNTYPICLGYARSDDSGKTWDVDFSKPALAPNLKFSQNDLFIKKKDGSTCVNYLNGLIEDPRLFHLMGKYYMTVAGRLFPCGPYWLDKNPHTQKSPLFVPRWVSQGEHKLGQAAEFNPTVSHLFEVNLDALSVRDYKNAFLYITNLTSPQQGDNRDAVLFPEKLLIDGRKQFVCLHRPQNAAAFFNDDSLPQKPCMAISAADTFEDFTNGNAKHKMFAKPIFDWEQERIGASFPPIRIDNKHWLISYHGKKNSIVGYTQSFMIVKEIENDFPEIIHRCSERLMYPHQDWELEGLFATPCLFSTGAVLQNNTLMIGYGAADTKVGIASCDFNKLVDYIKKYNAKGELI